MNALLLFVAGTLPKDKYPDPMWAKWVCVVGFAVCVLALLPFAVTREGKKP